MYVLLAQGQSTAGMIYARDRGRSRCGEQTGSRIVLDVPAERLPGRRAIGQHGAVGFGLARNGG